MKRRLPLAICGTGALVLVAAPLLGWPALIRLPAVALPALILLWLTLRPWRWTESQRDALSKWQPSRRLVCLSAVGTGLLHWFVLTRLIGWLESARSSFKAGSIRTRATKNASAC